MSLQDKVAIVTGAARGIGLATAKELAQRGAIAVLLDIKAETLSAALAEVRAIDPRARSYVADVSKKAQLQAAFDSVVKEFGRIDILVNNAGIAQSKPFEELTEEEWDRMMAVNLKGVFFGCQCVAPIMKKQRYGRIVSISSQAGKLGGILVGAHYAVAKAGVICLTKSIAHALAPYNITVNCVAPGVISTDLFADIPGIQNLYSRIPLGQKPGDPSDVAKAIAFLASDDARYITGETTDVNGGFLMD